MSVSAVSSSNAPQFQSASAFSADEREAVYRAIFTRRDVRGQFLTDPVPDDVLRRILTAAHHAPSVGFMQPWNFLVIRDASIKQRIAANFAEANAEAAALFPQERRVQYRSLKLEGITAAPVNICVTCDLRRGGPVVLGATHMNDMDLFSTVCAIQNLWLAARAEDVGVGWVSILKEEDVKTILGIPPEIRMVAYLCLGKTSSLHQSPELEQRGWRKRIPIDELIYYDNWGEQTAQNTETG